MAYTYTDKRPVGAEFAFVQGDTFSIDVPGLEGKVAETVEFDGWYGPVAVFTRVDNGQPVSLTKSQIPERLFVVTGDVKVIARQSAWAIA